MRFAHRRSLLSSAFRDGIKLCYPPRGISNRPPLLQHVIRYRSSFTDDDDYDHSASPSLARMGMKYIKENTTRDHGRKNGGGDRDRRGGGIGFRNRNNRNNDANVNRQQQQQQQQPRDKRSYYFISDFLKNSLQSATTTRGGIKGVSLDAETKLLSLVEDFLSGRDPSGDRAALFTSDLDRSRGISLLMKQISTNVQKKSDAFRLVAKMWGMVVDAWNAQQQQQQQDTEGKLQDRHRLVLDDHMFVTVLLQYQREIEHMDGLHVGEQNAGRRSELLDEANEVYNLFLQTRHLMNEKIAGDELTEERQEGKNEKAQEEIDEVEGRTKDRSVGVFAAMMLLYLRSNQYQKLFEVYKDMVRQSVLPDKIVFTHIFDATSQLVRQAGDFSDKMRHTETALAFYHRYHQLMHSKDTTVEQKRAVQLDRIGVEALLRSVMLDRIAFLNVFQYVCSQADHQSQDRPFITVNIYTLLLNFLLDNETYFYEAKFGDTSTAIDSNPEADKEVMLNKRQTTMKEGTDTGTILPSILDALLPEDPANIGITVVKHMKSMQVEPTSFTVGKLIHVFAERSDYRAFVLLHYAERELRVQPNLRTFSTLLDLMDILRKHESATDEEIMFFAKRAVNVATVILQRDRSQQGQILTKLPARSLTSMIRVYGYARQEVPDHLEQQVMHRVAISRNSTSSVIWINSLLTVHCIMGDVDRAVRLIHEAQSHHLDPDDVTVNIVAQHSDRDPATFEPLKQAMKNWQGTRQSIRLIPEVDVAYNTLMWLRSQGQNIKFNEYEHVIKLLGQTCDMRAFDVFHLSREDYPKSLNFRIYQAMFTSFRYVEFEMPMWTVYEQSYIKETDGRDSYPFQVMLKLVTPGSVREKQLLQDMARFGMHIVEGQRQQQQQQQQRRQQHQQHYRSGKEGEESKDNDDDDDDDEFRRHRDDAVYGVI